MQAGRRRRDGARRAREHGLVTLAVARIRRALDVRRQRHFAVLAPKRSGIAIERELDEAVVARVDARAPPAVELDLGAGLRHVARTQLHEHAAGTEKALEQQLDASAARRALAAKARRQHASVVADEQVARMQEIGQIREPAVVGRPVLPSSTSSLLPLRLASGACAISSGGKS